MMASLILLVTAQVVIGVAKPMNSAIRPTIAGLAKFWPRPPKICLTTTIAMKQPIIAIQMGIFTGRLKARMTPVTTALQSAMVFSLPMILRTAHSKKTQAAAQTTVMSIALKPKT